MYSFSQSHDIPNLSNFLLHNTQDRTIFWRMWVVIKLLTIVTNVSFKTAPIESRKTSREQGGTLYRDSLTRSQCALQVSLTLSSKQNTPITFKREKRSKPRSKINVKKGNYTVIGMLYVQGIRSGWKSHWCHISSNSPWSRTPSQFTASNGNSISCDKRRTTFQKYQKDISLSTVMAQ